MVCQPAIPPMNYSSPNALWTLPPTLRRGKAQARGFSLLEVAIALVIFVFGALAIVRIFPGALRVITVGGSRQNALNLNRAAMARVQSNAISIPMATYDVGQNSDFSSTPTSIQGWVDGFQSGGSFEPRAVSGSTTRNYSLPRSSNLSDVDYSALGSVRAVFGEGTTVHTEGTQLFVLTQFPIYFDSTEVQVSKKVVLTGVTIDSTGALDFSDAREEKTGTPFILPDPTTLPANTTSLIYVTLRYRDNDTLWGLVDYPVLTSTKKAAFSYRSSIASNAVIAGQVEVTYQQTSSLPTPTVEDRGRGIISLGASGGQFSEGDQVFVNYQGDWQRILQEGAPDIVPEKLADSNVTPTLPRQIALAAPFIEDHATDSVLTTLYTKTGSNTFTLDKGRWGESVPAQGMLEPTPGDLRASRITFDLKANPNQTARVSYRTRDQWSQQLSVAASSYKPFFGGAVEPWRDYYLNSTGTTIFFHASEAGKSVMVTYTYFDGTSNITLRNRLLSIEDDAIQPGGLPSGFNPTNSGYASRLPLTDAEGNDLAANQLISISGVRGASVTIRTAWLDGSRYTQSFLTAMRAGTSAEAMP